MAPLEGLLELARRHRCRLMVDEAHATGTVGPGGRGTVAAAGLGGEVDLLVGTLGKALGSYGAYVCASSQMVEYLLNTVRSFIFSTALPPPVVAAAQAALALLEAEPEMVQRLGVNAAVLREALAAEGFSAGVSESQIVPVRVGGSEQAMVLSRGAARTRHLRPGDPAADGAGGNLAAPLHGDVHARPDGAPARGEGARRRHPQPRPERARGPGRSSPPRARCAGVFVTGTGTEVGKTVVAAVLARTLAASGSRGRGVQARRHRPRRPRRARPRAAAARRRLRAERRGDRPLPLRAAGVAASGRLAGGRGDRPGAAPRSRRGRGRRGRRAGLRGRRGLLVPLAAEYLVRDLAVDARPAGGRRGRARPRHDQPHAPHRRGGREPRRSRSRWSCSRPGPSAPSAIEASNLETIAALGEVRGRDVPRLDLRDPGPWPALLLRPRPG